jgi:signal recognition particle subunit SRP54
VFNNLSDRLTATFKNLRGKGRLTEHDINATLRDIRMALLDADVALPVVKAFTAAIRERALGAEVSQALNPGQQVVKIVNEELVDHPRRADPPAQSGQDPPTVIMLAGLQGSGKTTLAGKLGYWLKEQGTRRCSWPPTCSGPMPSPSSRWSGSAPECRSMPRARQRRRARRGRRRR